MHPLIAAAADGQLPDWAEATPDRRAHMARVAEVMEEWGSTLGIGPEELRRWRAAAMLHDALRDADPDALRDEVPEEFAGWPDGMLHGPAAAGRLETEGVADHDLLAAIGWHTVGHPDLGAVGRALYLADYTEPGRGQDAERLARLRARVPDDMDSVLREVLAERIGLTLEGGHPLRSPTVAFWNSLVNHG